MNDKLQTVVGKTITIKGEIVGEESLTIEGRVEGKIALENSIYVRETGIVIADVTVQSIIIAGSVTGNITASDKVEVLRGGIMVGDIKSPRVVINDGANLKGHVEMDMSQEKLLERQKVAAEAALQAAKPIPSTRVAESVIPKISTAPSIEPTPIEPPQVSPSEVIESQRRAFGGILSRR